MNRKTPPHRRSRSRRQRRLRELFTALLVGLVFSAFLVGGLYLLYYQRKF